MVPRQVLETLASCLDPHRPPPPVNHPYLDKITDYTLKVDVKLRLLLKGFAGKLRRSSAPPDRIKTLMQNLPYDLTGPAQPLSPTEESIRIMHLEWLIKRGVLVSNGEGFGSFLKNRGLMQEGFATSHEPLFGPGGESFAPSQGPAMVLHDSLPVMSLRDDASLVVGNYARWGKGDKLTDQDREDIAFSSMCAVLGGYDLVVAGGDPSTDGIRAAVRKHAEWFDERGSELGMGQKNKVIYFQVSRWNSGQQQRGNLI
jgi:hypothetical protein